MALTGEQAADCTARLDTASGQLLDIEALLRDSGRLGSIDGQMLTVFQGILGVVAEIVTAVAEP